MLHLSSQEPRCSFCGHLCDKIDPLPESNPPSKILYMLHPEILKYIDFVSLMPYLNRYEVLTPNERESMERSTNVVKVNLFLEYLSKKSDETINDFVRALHQELTHTGHKELIQILHDRGIYLTTSV